MFGDTFWMAAAVIVVVLGAAITMLVKLGELIRTVKVLNDAMTPLLTQVQKHEVSIAEQAEAIKGLRSSVDHLYHANGV